MQTKAEENPNVPAEFRLPSAYLTSLLAQHFFFFLQHLCSAFHLNVSIKRQGHKQAVVIIPRLDLQQDVKSFRRALEHENRPKKNAH